MQKREENIYKVDEDVNRVNHQIVNQTNGIYLSNSNNLTLNINSLASFNRLGSQPILTVNYRFINNKPDVEGKLLFRFFFRITLQQNYLQKKLN